MSLMNSSKLIRNILGYLRMNKNVSEDILKLINECLDEIEETNEFKYIYRKYDYKLDFLNCPGYLSVMENSKAYYLIASEGTE